jgi:hypothetical protein
MSLPSLFKESLSFGLLSTFTWPAAGLFWGGSIAAVFLCIAGRAKSPITVIPPTWYLGMLATIPVLLLVVGALFPEAAPAGTITSPVILTLYALGLAQVAVAYLFVWKYRASFLLALTPPVLALAWTLGALIVTEMSVTGNWL